MTAEAGQAEWKTWEVVKCLSFQWRLKKQANYYFVQVFVMYFKFADKSNVVSSLFINL